MMPQVTMSLDSKPPLLDRANGPTARRAGHLSNWRLVLAFAVAGISDGIFKWVGELVPPIEWGLDLVTALALFAILGWRWAMLPALIMEAIPGVSVLPYWVLVVVTVAIQDGALKKRAPGDGDRFIDV
jgi:hypothetical protein